MRKTGSKKVLALLLVIAFIAFIYLANPVGFIMSRLDTLGYVGVFLIMLLSSATIILPAPGLAGVVIAGAFLNPFWVGVAGGTGSALGELSGYFAGFGGKVIIERKRRKVYKLVREWMRRNGFVTIFVFAALPNPLFDLAGLAAGALEYPLWKFLLACLAGKILKSIVFAYLGYSLA